MENNNGKTEERRPTITTRLPKGTCECGVDFILPDYKPDIKRVLHSEARALKASEYTTEDGGEIGGIVAFDVLYLSSENRPASVSFSGEWSYTRSGCRGESWSDVCIDGLSVRLTGPRRIAAKCKVEIDASETWAPELEPCGTAFENGSDPEISEEWVSARKTVVGEVKERELACEVTFLRGVASDEVEVIFQTGNVCISEVNAKEGEVSVSGDVVVNAVVSVGEESPKMLTAKLPFDETVKHDGIGEETQVVASGQLSSLVVSPVAVEDGVRITADAVIDFCTKAHVNVPIKIALDAFSLKAEVENEYGTLEYHELKDVKRTSVRKGREVAKSETDAPYATDIVYLDAAARAEKVTLDGSSVKIDGEILFSGVACEVFEDGTSTYSSFRVPIPFSENVNFGMKIADGSTVEYSVCIEEARMDLDTRSFYAECTLCIGCAVLEPHTKKYLASSQEKEETIQTDDGCVVSVYYPCSGESLFEVAKKFRTSPIRIAEDNSLTESALASLSSPTSLLDAKKLIIRKM